MRRAPRSRQRHELYAKYHEYDSEISDLLGECGMNIARAADATIARAEYILARYVISTDKDVGRLYQSEWRRAGLQLELLARQVRDRSEEHTSELQSLMRISYAVLCLKKKNKIKTSRRNNHHQTHKTIIISKKSTPSKTS